MNIRNRFLQIHIGNCLSEETGSLSNTNQVDIFQSLDLFKTKFPLYYYPTTAAKQGNLFSLFIWT